MSDTTTNVPMPNLLRLPTPTKDRHRSALNRLSPAKARPDWLPVGLGEGVDRCREEHLRLLAAVGAAQAELEQLEHEWRKTDAAYDTALAAAIRTGNAAPEDNRVPAARRDARRGPILE